jgi:DNA-binding Lrp family transcriptional regulator
MEEQFTQIPHSLMSDKDLTDQDKLTLGLILSWVKNDKECFMGNEYIAEMMGISKNAASIRIKRLEKIGCISLRYTYREGTKEVDKRFITLLSITPKVSSDRQEVSSRRRRGIVSQTKGSRPTDDEVSSKQGGIIQPDYTSLLNNELKKLPHNVLHNEISLEEQLEQIIILINENKFETNDARGNAYQEKSKIEIQLKQLTNEQSRN